MHSADLGRWVGDGIPWFWAQPWELDQVISPLGLRYLVCKERKCCLAVETVPGLGAVAGGPRFPASVVLFEVSLASHVPTFPSAVGAHSLCTVGLLLRAAEGCLAPGRVRRLCSKETSSAPAVSAAASLSLPSLRPPVSHSLVDCHSDPSPLGPSLLASPAHLLTAECLSKHGPPHVMSCTLLKPFCASCYSSVKPALSGLGLEVSFPLTLLPMLWP